MGDLLSRYPRCLDKLPVVSGECRYGKKTETSILFGIYREVL